jgi:hypothetical protein
VECPHRAKQTQRGELVPVVVTFNYDGLKAKVAERVADGPGGTE